MKVILEFDSTFDTSACTGVTAVSAYGGGLSGASFTPTGGYAIITGEGGTVVPDSAYRTYYVDFPVVSAGNYLNGVYSIVGESTGASAVNTFSTDEAVRDYQTIIDSAVIKTLISGSKVVNTTLNELVYYADVVNSDGSVTGTGAKATLLLRQKLYDAQGVATSINPVEKRSYNSTMAAYINSLVSGGLSALQ